MNEEAEEAVERVRAALAQAGCETEVRAFPQGTATSADAAAAIGCTLGQIAKSIVFRSGDEPVLVVASGPNRVDRQKVAACLGREVKSAGPDWVLARTGYGVGGVPPLGHTTEVLTVIDQDLAAFDEIWAAAGSPMHVFRTSPTELFRLTRGVLADVRQD